MGRSRYGLYSQIYYTCPISNAKITASIKRMLFINTQTIISNAINIYRIYFNAKVRWINTLKQKTRQRDPKSCHFCMHSTEVLYRIKTLKHQDWVFACKQCQSQIKQNDSTYQYGGTWKQNKR